MCFACVFRIFHKRLFRFVSVNFQNFSLYYVKSFQLSVAFHIETSHLICSAKQITGFYLKLNMGWNGLNHFAPLPVLFPCYPVSCSDLTMPQKSYLSPIVIYLFKFNNGNTRAKLNMFKVNIKYIRTTSLTLFWCFYS